MSKHLLRLFRATPILGMACALTLAGCTGLRPSDKEASTGIAGYRVVSSQRGEASWYSVRTNRGTHTASGQRLNDQSATAAHRTLPFGTRVKVTNELNGLSEIVTINNRGPHIRGRIIDVTIGTAERLGFRSRGIAPVKVEVMAKVE